MWTGTNIQNDDLHPADEDTASDITDGDENNGATQATSGYEIHWDYFDLRFTYGGYTHDRDTETDGGETSASAFRIAYTVNF